MKETYLTAKAEKIADDQVLVSIQGPLDQQAKLISLTVGEFQAIYRLVFELMRTELTKSEEIK